MLLSQLWVSRLSAIFRWLRGFCYNCPLCCVSVSICRYDVVDVWWNFAFVYAFWKEFASFVQSIKNVIRRHNNRILVTPWNRSTEDKCNCRKKDEWPLLWKMFDKEHYLQGRSLHYRPGPNNENIHWDDIQRIQTALPKPRKIIQQREIQKRNRTIKICVETKEGKA